MNCEESSLNLEDYTLGQIKEFALKFLKSRNKQIKYYKSETGKQKYRECAKRYYYKHREKCLAKRKKQYREKLLAEGKVPQGRRGRPSKKK